MDIENKYFICSLNVSANTFNNGRIRSLKFCFSLADLCKCCCNYADAVILSQHARP